MPLTFIISLCKGELSNGIIMERKSQETQKQQIDERILSQFLGEDDLKAVRGNINELGLQNIVVNQVERDTVLDIESPKKRILAVPKRLTIGDIVDEKQPKKRKKRDSEDSSSRSLKKRSPPITHQEFLEDKKDITIEDFFDSVSRPAVPSKKKKLKTVNTKWDLEETKKFYQVLELVGLDFSLTEQFFSDRSRKQLLSKYRKERKANPEKINNVLEMHQTGHHNRKNRCKALLVNFEGKTSNLSAGLESSMDSLDQTINDRLKIMLDTSLENRINDEIDEHELKPLDYYLQQIDSGLCEGDKVKKEEDDTQATDHKEVLVKERFLFKSIPPKKEV